MVTVLLAGVALVWQVSDLASVRRAEPACESASVAPPSRAGALRLVCLDATEAEETRVVVPSPRRPSGVRALVPNRNACTRGRIVGRAFESCGAPIAGMSVWLVAAGGATRVRYLASFERPHHELVTTADGRFEFQGVAAGRWLVGPAPEGGENGVAPMPVLVDVHADGRDTAIEIRAQRDLVIRGVVLQASGERAFSGFVSARAQGTDGAALAPIRSDGSFAIGPLVGGGHELWAHGEWEGSTSAVVLAFDGDRDIVLRLGAGGAIDGRVDGSFGSAVPVSLVAMRQDVPPHEWLGASADERGHFRFDNVAAGRYQLVAHTADAWFAVRSGVDVSSGGTADGVALELREGGRLRVRHAGDDALHVEIRLGDVLVFASAIRERDSELAVPAGRLTVRWGAGYEPARETALELAPGEVRELAWTD